MPSPFPGMNPYLEQTGVWQDFHNSFVVALREGISPLISPHFFARVEEYLFIHEPSAEERIRLGKPDVFVSGAGPQASTSAATASMIDAPRQVLVSTDFEIEKHLFLQVVDRDRRDTVAIIEVLSPSNKAGNVDRDVYLAKRRNILRSSTHFVEI